MSRKNVGQTRSTPTLMHKAFFPYECVSREALAVRLRATRETLVGRVIRQNCGNIRDYKQNNRILLEQRGAISAMLFHRLPPYPEPGGCYATTLATPDPPSRARRALA